MDPAETWKSNDNQTNVQWPQGWQETELQRAEHTQKVRTIKSDQKNHFWAEDVHKMWSQNIVRWVSLWLGFSPLVNQSIGQEESNLAKSNDENVKSWRWRLQLISAQSPTVRSVHWISLRWGCMCVPQLMLSLGVPFKEEKTSVQFPFNRMPCHVQSISVQASILM